MTKSVDCLTDDLCFIFLSFLFAVGRAVLLHVDLWLLPVQVRQLHTEHLRHLLRTQSDGDEFGKVGKKPQKIHIRNYKSYDATSNDAIVSAMAISQNQRWFGNIAKSKLDS